MYHIQDIPDLSHFLSVADDVWVFPVSGCVPVRVHSAAPQSAAGPAQTADTALLRPQVIDTLFSGYAWRNIPKSITFVIF